MKHLFLAAALAAVFAAGCQTSKSTSGLPRPTSSMMTPPYPAERAEVRAGDRVTVKFTRHPEFDTLGRVEMDGTFGMPLLGVQHFAGKSTIEVRDELVAAYSKYLKNPDIVVTTDSPGAVVYVAGAARAGGALPYRTNMTVAMALAASSPDMAAGDVNNTILVRRDAAAPSGYQSYLVGGDFATGAAKNVYLMPDDVVIVPKKGTDLAGDAARDYVRETVSPGGEAGALGLGFGFTRAGE